MSIRRILMFGLSAVLSGSGLAMATADDPKTAAPNTVEPKAADSDAALPEGFPGATKPGTIEVKACPAYRSAVAKGEGMTTRSGDLMFRSLFRQISTHKVEMAAPVINTYKTPRMMELPNLRGEVTMEFLYPRMKEGKTGPDSPVVEVVDHPSAQFVCLGLQEGMDDQQMRGGVKQLQGWLEEHKSEWVEAGPPRRLGYHGPMTPVARRLWEVQIPIKAALAAGQEKAAGETTPSN